MPTTFLVLTHIMNYNLEQNESLPKAQDLLSWLIFIVNLTAFRVTWEIHFQEYLGGHFQRGLTEEGNLA